MKKKQKIIAPSILSADFANLERDIRMVESAEADWLHIDVMDGHYVPNITIGPPVVTAINKVTNIPLDVHLMITNPERYIDAFAKAGADYLTVHVETVSHLHRVIQMIKSRGMKAGVSLNPATPLYTIEEVFEDLDLILIMSVNPGFGGQSFIPNTLNKLKKLRNLLNYRSIDNLIVEVDGGVKLDNIGAIAAAGCDAFVSGSGIFKETNPVATIRKMKAIIG